MFRKHILSVNEKITLVNEEFVGNPFYVYLHRRKNVNKKITIYYALEDAHEKGELPPSGDYRIRVYLNMKTLECKYSFKPIKK